MAKKKNETAEIVQHINDGHNFVLIALKYHKKVSDIEQIERDHIVQAR